MRSGAGGMVRWAVKAGLGGGGWPEERKEFHLWRAPSGGQPGRLMRQVEMAEDALHGGGQGDERDDPHLALAGGAQEREDLVDAGQELGPEHAARS
jgi:hypothetical protein